MLRAGHGTAANQNLCRVLSGAAAQKRGGCGRSAPGGEGERLLSCGDGSRARCPAVRICVPSSREEFGSKASPCHPNAGGMPTPRESLGESCCTGDSRLCASAADAKLSAPPPTGGNIADAASTVTLHPAEPRIASPGPSPRRNRCCSSICGCCCCCCCQLFWPYQLG